MPLNLEIQLRVWKTELALNNAIPMWYIGAINLGVWKSYFVAKVRVAGLVRVRPDVPHLSSFLSARRQPRGEPIINQLLLVYHMLHEYMFHYSQCSKKFRKFFFSFPLFFLLWFLCFILLEDKLLILFKLQELHKLSDLHQMSLPGFG